jgi:hypothetical protein
MFNDFDPFKKIKLSKCACKAKPCGIFRFGNKGKPFSIRCENCGGQIGFYTSLKEAVKAWEKTVKCNA